ncbi:hypothetical protein F5I97DRAFT_1903549 [Phlebopus sp. FC_14]|nr:hypothetical protein F5I97DRAFT_1903549 [Phlebopus sp. FC_14]
MWHQSALHRLRNSWLRARSMTSNPKTFQESESLYSRAAKSELSSDFTTAFRLYLAAADAFLNLSRSQPHPTLQARCKANANKALERAEKIKKASQKPGGGVGLEPLANYWFGPVSCPS